MHKKIVFLTLGILSLPFLVFAQSRPLKVVATTADLGAIAREIGGDEISVEVLANAGEDPHFVTPKPSFVRTLARADLLVQNGLDLEVGWLPPLIEQARNATILNGASGNFDASRFIEPLGVSKGLIDRTMGDVHAHGNPHFLLDPINGLAVAKGLATQLSTLRPLARKTFSANYERFRQDLLQQMMGASLAKDYDAEKLARLYSLGKLRGFLEEQHRLSDLTGWFSLMLPFQGEKIVTEHDLWAYFASRFGLNVIGQLEPKPGVPPTSRHLGQVVSQMTAQEVRIILTAPYYDPKFARFIADKTGAQNVKLLSHPGTTPQTQRYSDFIHLNIETLAAALVKKDQSK